MKGLLIYHSRHIFSAYRIAGMFRGVKVSFFKEKTIFVGFISVLSSRSISNTGPSNRVTFSWVKLSFLPSLEQKKETFSVRNIPAIRYIIYCTCIISAYIYMR